MKGAHATKTIADGVIRHRACPYHVCDQSVGFSQRKRLPIRLVIWAVLMNTQEHDLDRKQFMHALAVSASTMIAASVIFVVPNQISFGNEPSSPAPSAVYAKIVLPIGHPYWSQDEGGSTKSLEGSRPAVESWIANKAFRLGKTKVRAATQWIRLAEKGEEHVALWAGWGCPVEGRVVERTADGKIKVELSGWAPVLPKIKGRVLSSEVGSRRVAVVDVGVDDGPYAYVGLVVGPPVPNTSSP
jgi:hypothetical protein